MPVLPQPGMVCLLMAAGAVVQAAPHGYAFAHDQPPPITRAGTAASRGGAVQPRLLTAAQLAHRVDNHLDQRLEAEGVIASGAADDASWLRRLYLDLTGVIPPTDEVIRFTASQHSAKRAEWIDKLLSSPEFGRHLADTWDTLLFQRTPANQNVPLEPLTRWLEQQLNANRPWDEVVYELLTAQGPQYLQPAVTPFMAGGKVALAPHEATDLVSRVFLGVRLECAQCHDHPFAEWTHADYWGMAAFFKKTRFTKKFAQQPDSGQRAVRRGDLWQVGIGYGVAELPRINNRPPPAPQPLSVPARHLNGVPAQLSLDNPWRPHLATWITSPRNPWFARAMANRVWAQLFARGLVHPVDDFHKENPPSHPQILAQISAQFVAHGFDLKFLYRTLCNSRAYGRSSTPRNGPSAQAHLYATMPVKVMSPEQLFDSLQAVLGPQALVKKGRLDIARHAFVSRNRTRDDADPTRYTLGVGQRLRLLSDQRLERAIGVRAGQFAEGDMRREEIVEQLYLETLGRRPSDVDRRRAMRFIDQQHDSAAGYTGLLWALIHTAEFALYD